MKKSIVAPLALLSVLGLASASIPPAMAAVNCGMVKKDLDRGKKAEDISERMGISVAEVNKCKEQGGEGTTAPATPASSPLSENSKMGAPGSRPVRK
jgi:hypothetical protein